ncbi:MAG: hypothetical protein M3R37_07745 [Actinomycetota bacterium]|nr:hypothetical protein [Actinomycetota bacterium]
MNNEQEIASFGDVPADEVGRAHSDGFAHALERALADLDGRKYAGKELIVRQSVCITPNPGGVGQYRVELIPKG